MNTGSTCDRIFEVDEFTLSPAILFGLTFFMMQTASMTIRTPSGGRCMARTSTTSFLLSDLRLVNAASCGINIRSSIHEEI